MARTESKSMQVHPDDEQQMINLMQKFHWSLLSTQEILVKDSHLEEGISWTSGSGETIVSVTETTHYVKLAFSRDIDLPNLDKIRELEDKYFGLPEPSFPKLLPGGLILLVFWYPFWPFYYFFYYQKNKKIADSVLQNRLQRRREILQEVDAIK